MDSKDEERRRVIDDLVADALELSPEERPEFLSRACEADRELRKQAESLIEDALRHGELDASTLTFAGLHPLEIVAGRFRIVRFLAEGGMGQVYEVDDLDLRTRKALKTIKPTIAGNPAMMARFKREIAVGHSVTHPNVCRVYDLGQHYSGSESGGREQAGPPVLFMTMQLLAPGDTLARYLRTHGSIAPEHAVVLLRQMAEGLDALHREGYIHRDLKSANVMLVGAEQPPRKAVITDLGLARSVSHSTVAWLSLAQSGRSGTPAYMAPEQFAGGVLTPATDLYALGVVAYEMITGRPPFTSEQARQMALNHDGERPRLQPLAGLNPRWASAVLRCLEPDPAKRFVSASEFLAAVGEPGSSSRPAVAADTREAGEQGHGTRRWPWNRLVKVAAAVIAVALFFLGWLYRARIRSNFFGPAERRIAVLGFNTTSTDADDQAFCRGLREDVTGRLAQLEQFDGALSVIPASEIRGDSVITARQARAEFGANLAITGSVRRSKAGVKVTVVLIDANRVKQLGSMEAFVTANELPEIEEAVVRDVAGLLDMQLKPEAGQALHVQGSTNSPGAYGYYLQGYGYLRAGYPTIDQAITEFQHALEQDQSYALAYAGLGEAYWRKYVATRDRRWIDEAWRACSKALSLNAHIAPAHTTLAMLYSGTGHYDDALRECAAALAIDPRSRDAHAQQAAALEAAGRLGAAEDALKQTIAMRPDYWDGYYQLGQFYARYGDYRKAEVNFRRVVELVPDNSVGYANLGVMYYYQGRAKDAEQLFLKSLSLRPTPATYSNLATTYFFQGRFAEAAAIYKKQAASSDDYSIWGNLGDALRWTPGQRASAAPAYRRAISLAQEAAQVNPKDADALSSLGLYYAKLGEDARAAEFTRRALGAAPENRDVLYAAAVVFELKGDRSGALNTLEKAARLGYTPFEIMNDPELRDLRRDGGFSRVRRFLQH